MVRPHPVPEIAHRDGDALARLDGRLGKRHDVGIHRHGEYIGYYVVSAGAAAALGLAVVEAEPFWISNVIFLAFVLAAVVTSAVKIVAYRRGF